MQWLLWLKQTTSTPAQVFTTDFSFTHLILVRYIYMQSHCHCVCFLFVDFHLFIHSFIHSLLSSFLSISHSSHNLLYTKKKINPSFWLSPIVSTDGLSRSISSFRGLDRPCLLLLLLFDLDVPTNRRLLLLLLLLLPGRPIVFNEPNRHNATIFSGKSPEHHHCRQ